MSAKASAIGSKSAVEMAAKDDISRVSEKVTSQSHEKGCRWNE